jgi:hypothetical protein
VSLHDAHKLAIEVYLSRELADERLIDLLRKTGPKDWRYQQAKHGSPGQAITNFWRRGSPPVVNWEDSSAYRFEVHDSEAAIVRGVTLYGIAIAEHRLMRGLGLQAQQSATTEQSTQRTNKSDVPIGPVDTQAWITAHLKQMIDRNEIPKSGVRIGQLSESLAADMLTAKETNKWLKPVGAHYIRTHLREWVAAAGLDIKIL